MKFESKFVTVCLLGLATAWTTLRDPAPAAPVLPSSPAQGPGAVGAFMLQRWGGDRIGGDKLARIDTRTGETWLAELDPGATEAAGWTRYRWASVGDPK